MSAVGETSVFATEASTRAARDRPWPRGWLVRRALVAADLLGLVFAFVLTEELYGSVADSKSFATPAEVGLFILTLPIWILLAKLYTLYDRDEERTDHRTSDDVAGVFHLTTVGTWFVFAASRLADVANPDLGRVTVFWGVAIVAIVFARAVARTLCRRHSSYVQNTIVIGAGKVGQMIGRKLKEHPEYGLRLVGFVDHERFEGAPTLGQVDMLPALVREYDVGRVIVSFTDDPYELLLEQVRRLNSMGVQIDIVPRFYDVIGRSVDVHMAGGVALLGLRPLNLPRSSLVVKRAFDAILAAAALILLSPLLCVVALLIKLDSRGPVFFRQPRVGSKNRLFLMWKFRTMVADAEARKAGIAHLNMHAREGGDSRMFKAPDDPRATRVGRFLRRYSLDELPQLLNVLADDMSVVGPRPLIPEEHRHVTEWRKRRLDLKPGMTGAWQVFGRSSIPFEEMVTLDYQYVTNWSLWGDLSLIIRTIPEVLRGGSGAY